MLIHPIHQPSSAVSLSWRAALSLLLALLFLLPLSARAATYTFKSDTYAWETTTNTITWDRLCTQYPGDDDQATIALTGGFTFTFAGTAYSSVRVLANGALQFGADTGFLRTYTNTVLPAGTAAGRAGCTAGATARTIMAYWDDLDPSHAGSGGVTWQQKGTAPNRYLVVSWNGVYQYSTTTPYSFQIILYENGEFKYQYGNDNATGASATIGVQVSNTDYTQYSFNSGYNANGTAIRWFIPSGTPTRLAEYRMDEYSYAGNTGEVSDSTGNGYGGVRVGSAASNAGGYVCRAVDIPANTTTAISAIDTTVDVDSALGADGSISFWYRGNNAWVSSPEAQLLDASGSASRPFFLTRKSTGALRFILSDSAGSLLDAQSSVQAIAAGTWTHIAVTWRLATGTNQSTLRIYVGGVQVGVATGTTNGALDTSLLTLFLGDNRTTAIPTNATSASANGRMDEVKVYNYEISALEIAADLAVTHTCLPPLHHVEIRHGSGTGLTCTPSTLTVAACQDASCATAYTGGLTGTLTATGTPSVVWPSGANFTIASGASTTTTNVQVTTPGSVLFGASSLSVTPSNATSCNFGSPACTFTATDAGLLFDVSDHFAESSPAPTFTVKAVRKSDNALSCTPAFASVSKAITFTCGYTNPSTGTLPIRVGTRALNAGNNASAACDATGQAVTLAFDATGTASTTVQYADVGQLSLTGKYTGSGSDAGLVMTSTDSFIAAPTSFAFSSYPTPPATVKAGVNFSATLTARNAAGAATPNFGKETTPAAPTVTFAKALPAGGSSGGFTGSFGSYSNGIATASNLQWSEVGQGDLTATLTAYLGSALGATGTTGSAGAVGRFTPDHFQVQVAAPSSCSGASFYYAGQPINTVTITAQNATNGATTNYNGAFARATTISDANALTVGSFSNNVVAAATFNTSGVATLSTPALGPVYNFTTKLTAESSVKLTATDTDSVTGSAASNTNIRSGRLVLTNGYGSEKSSLQLPVRTDYWSGAAWVKNTADSCTTIAATALALSNYRDYKGNVGSWTTSGSAITITSGSGTLTLAAPTGGATGTVDLALNLGSTTADQSCLTTHPATTGAGLAWLRSNNGSCAATYDRDPSARASFGVYSPETRKTVHMREIF
jgi:MSHA biogenesis protein MshQ